MFCRVVTAILFAYSGVSQIAYSQINVEQLQLVVKPTKCITLRQGRPCFAQIEIRWQSVIKDDFCLYHYKNEGVQQLIHCWENSQGERFIFNFESSEKITFELINQQNKNIRLFTAVEVSWVHKGTPQKRRWRLF